MEIAKESSSKYRMTWSPILDVDHDNPQAISSSSHSIRRLFRFDGVTVAILEGHCAV